MCEEEGKDQVFNTLSPSELNAHLQSLMPGLTAKVFRTYNASITLEKQLPPTIPHETPKAEQVQIYNNANREVSILCNHQRSVPKGFAASFEKLTETLKQKKRQLKELRKHLKLIRNGQEVPTLKKNYESPEEKKKHSHLFSRQPSEEQLRKRIASYKKSVTNQETTVKTKNDNKAVSLNTAKINYMDPRVTVAWCKRNGRRLKEFLRRPSGQVSLGYECSTGLEILILSSWLVVVVVVRVVDRLVVVRIVVIRKKNTVSTHSLSVSKKQFRIFFSNFWNF